MRDTLEAPAPIAFVLNARDRVKLHAQWQARDRDPRFVKYVPLVGLFSGIVPGLISTFDLYRHHRSEFAKTLTIEIVCLGVVIAVVLFGFYWSGARRYMRDTSLVDIAFEMEGISLNTDGARERVSWYAVADAYDLADCYGLARRDDSVRPILVPKRALADGGAELWSFLERRLTGSRPAIRDLGFAAPSHLTNTVEQFSFDRVS